MNAIKTAVLTGLALIYGISYSGEVHSERTVAPQVRAVRLQIFKVLEIEASQMDIADLKGIKRRVSTLFKAGAGMSEVEKALARIEDELKETIDITLTKKPYGLFFRSSYQYVTEQGGDWTIDGVLMFLSNERGILETADYIEVNVQGRREKYGPMPR
jgi:hypothetical protein